MPDFSNTPIFDLELVPDAHKSTAITKALGMAQFRVEPFVYAVASQFCPTYNGGLWNFETNACGAFAMTLPEAETFEVHNPYNGWSGTLNGRQFGVGACLIAYSALAGVRGNY